MEMIGQSCGVKNSKLIGSMNGIDFNSAPKLITSGVGHNYAVRTCSAKT